MFGRLNHVGRGRPRMATNIAGCMTWAARKYGSTWRYLRSLLLPLTSPGYLRRSFDYVVDVDALVGGKTAGGLKRRGDSRLLPSRSFSG